MSKKEIRRAARQAFPKAKPGAGQRTKSGARGRSTTSARNRGAASSQTLRPPSVKRAVITGALLGIIYFVLIEWAWKSGASTRFNVIIAVGGFFLYSGLSYWIERFKYQRKLRRLKGMSK